MTTLPPPVPAPFTLAEIAALRAATPATAHHIHLNHASTSLLPAAVTRAMEAFLVTEQAMGAHAAMDMRAGELEAVRRDVADLIGAQPRHIAFTDTATRGWMLALEACVAGGARSFATVRNEWGANVLNALRLGQRSGMRVALAATDSQGRADADQLLTLAGAGGVAALPLVPTASGTRNELTALAAEARRRDILLMVDAAQAVGQLPVDAPGLGADVMVFPARKWLRGPKGVAVLFLSDRALARLGPPAMVDLAGGSWEHDDTFTLRADARRFESFDFNPAVRLGLGAAARLANDLDPARIAARIRGLVTYTLTRLEARGVPLPLEDPGGAPTGLLTWAGPRPDVDKAVSALRTQGVFAAAISPNHARLALADRGAGTVLRVSIHYFNTEAEIDAFATRLAPLWMR